MASDDEKLLNVFHWFSGFGGGVGANENFLDDPRFQKFAKDTKLIDSKFAAPDVDLVFANIKVKPKADRRITFEQFKVAVQLIADKKYPGDPHALEKVYKKIFASEGPVASGTVADSGGILDKLTDTSLYTGAHKSRFNEDGTGAGLGGEKAPERPVVVAASGSKSPRPASAAAPAAASSGESKSPRPPTASAAPKSPRPAESSKAPAADDSNLSDDERLSNIFKAFCSFGGGATADGSMMDGPRFNKFAKDTKLVDAKFPASSVDLVFADVKVKPKADRRITFQQFKVALQLLAEKKHPGEGAAGLQKVYKKIFASGGPVAVGTKAEDDAILKKMTDASLYTGAHKERFDGDGKGKGLAGRDSVAKGAADPKGLASKVARK